MVRTNNILDPNQIVDPGSSDRAAFDPEAYHKAMREGRSEGALHYVAMFFGCACFVFFVLYGASVEMRFLAGGLAGLAGGLGLFWLRSRKLKQSDEEAVRLHAKAHELAVEAEKLEIEAAKASGAFDRWARK